MKRIFYSIFILSVIFFAACKKTSKSDKGDNTTISPNDPGTTLDKIKDSVFLYCKEDYLWYNSLPTYQAFNPRGYSGADNITALTNELNSISQIAINPTTHQPYEYYDSAGDAKYSFIDNGQVSSELNGNRGDFGFGILYNTDTDLRISYVYAGSPADQAGLKRGDIITSINGRTSISYDAPGFGDGSSNNLNFVVNAWANSNTISMTVTKSDGTALPAITNMPIANYTVNPVLTYKTFDEGNGHIVGYIVFNSFTSDDNADPQLNAAFTYFAGQNVTDLVVDLRYNGGGYVSTAEYLDNLIVPAAKSGTLMYNTYYNDILQSGKEVLLKNQWRKDPSSGQDYNYGPDYIDYSVANNAVNFNKQGSLNINRVFFIMTGHTASASELTINNLRPEMDVQFVGEQSYGKPVGFFDIDINAYQMYTPEFYTQNSANQGGYYQGFIPGDSGYPGFADSDDVTKDFGDPSEGLLADILSYVQNNKYPVKQTTHSIFGGQHTFSLETKRSIAKTFAAAKFNGMVMNRHKFKKH
jgi:carboxyl-terminal processing protease